MGRQAALAVSPAWAVRAIKVRAILLDPATDNRGHQPGSVW
jgi:hypothetical protein